MSRRPKITSRWLVERERFQLAASRPPEPEKQTAIGTVISAVVHTLDRTQSDWQTALRKEWATLAGPVVARHTRPGPMARQSLIVLVDNASWLNEISRQWRNPLLTLLQERFGKEKIRDLIFRIHAG